MSKVFEKLHKFGPTRVGEVVSSFNLKSDAVSAMYGPINDHSIWDALTSEPVEIIVEWTDGTYTTYPAVWWTTTEKDFETLYDLEQGITIDKLVVVW